MGVLVKWGIRERSLAGMKSVPHQIFVRCTHFMSALHLGNNFVSDGHVCNTFCPVLQKLVDVGLKTF